MTLLLFNGIYIDINKSLIYYQCREIEYMSHSMVDSSLHSTNTAILLIKLFNVGVQWNKTVYPFLIRGEELVRRDL